MCVLAIHVCEHNTIQYSTTRNAHLCIQAEHVYVSVPIAYTKIRYILTYRMHVRRTCFERTCIPCVSSTHSIHCWFVSSIQWHTYTHTHTHAYTNTCAHFFLLVAQI